MSLMPPRKRRKAIRTVLLVNRPKGFKLPKKAKSKRRKLTERLLLGGTPVAQIVGLTNFGETRIFQIKRELEKEGILPEYPRTKWKTYKGKTPKNAQVRRAIITSPAKKTIEEYAEQLKFGRSTVHRVINQMKKENLELRRKRLKPFKIQVKSGLIKLIPELTGKQKKVFRQVQPLVTRAVNEKAGKWGFDSEIREELRQESAIKMRRWIHKHNPAEMSQTLIDRIIINVLADLAKTKEQQQTGLSRLETQIGRKLEKFMKERTQQIEQQKQRKLMPGEETQILAKAIKEVNNTTGYAKQMKHLENFPKGKLTLKEAMQILSARKTQKEQERIDDRRNL